MVNGTITIEFSYDKNNPEKTSYKISDTVSLDSKSIIDVLTFIISTMDNSQD